MIVDEGDKVYMTTVFKGRTASAEVHKKKRKKQGKTEAKKTKKSKKQTKSLPFVNKEASKKVALVLNDKLASFSGGITLETSYGKINFISVQSAVENLLKQKSIITAAKEHAFFYSAKDDQGHTFVVTYVPKFNLVGVRLNDKTYHFLTSKPKFIYVLLSYALEPLKSFIPKHLDELIEIWQLILDQLEEVDYIRFATDDLDEKRLENLILKLEAFYKVVKEELQDKIDTTGFEYVNIEPLISFQLEDHITLGVISNFFKLIVPVFHAFDSKTSCTLVESLLRKIEPELYEKLVLYVDRRMRTIVSGVERIQFWTWLSQFVDIESIAIELLHLQLCDFLVHALEVRSYPAYLVSLTEKALNLYFMVNIKESIQYFENLGFVTASPHKKYKALLFDRDVKTFVTPFIEERWSDILDAYDRMVENLGRMQHILLIISPYLYKVGYNYSQFTLSKEKLPVAIFLAALLKKFNFHYLPMLLLSYRESGFPPEEVSSWKVFSGPVQSDDVILDTWLRTSIPTIRLLFTGHFVHTVSGKKFKIDKQHLAAIGQELRRYVQLLSRSKRLQFGSKVMSAQN